MCKQDRGRMNRIHLEQPRTGVRAWAGPHVVLTEVGDESGGVWVTRRFIITWLCVIMTPRFCRGHSGGEVQSEVWRSRTSQTWSHRVGLAGSWFCSCPAWFPQVSVGLQVDGVEDHYSRGVWAFQFLISEKHRRPIWLAAGPALPLLYLAISWLNKERDNGGGGWLSLSFPPSYKRTVRACHALRSVKGKDFATRSLFWLKSDGRKASLEQEQRLPLSLSLLWFPSPIPRVCPCESGKTSLGS